MSLLNLVRHEFIGRTITHNGERATIIDETKHSFIIETKTRRKRLLKSNATFSLTWEGKDVTIDASQLQMRPEDRIKIKKWKQQ